MKRKKIGGWKRGSPGEARRAGRCGRWPGKLRVAQLGVGVAGLTLIEMLVVAAVLAVLAALGWVHFQQMQVRAKVSASRSQLRTLSGGIEIYRLDHATYPTPQSSFPSDPFGVLAASALRGLTTPVSYVSSAAFRDPFGALRIQIGTPGGVSLNDPFRPPEPGFNTNHSLLYFHYPHFALVISNPELNADAYAAISIGPDLKDSFISYYPFPDSLPANAWQFGILDHTDTVYDPTNGTLSGGDLAGFGGELPVPSIVGGGDF